MRSQATPLVIGGGPAGSIFAAALARAGHAVTLLEKSKEAHDKVCGEFLSREAMGYLQRLGLDVPALGAVPIRSVHLVTPWFRQQTRLPFCAWSITRRIIDEELLALAERQGVQVHRGAHVASLQKDGNDWSATLRDGCIYSAQNVILATGKLDLGGWARPNGKWPHLLAFKMYYRLTAEQFAAVRDAVELILYPGGYAGLQPVQGGAVNLCFLVDARRLSANGSRADAAFQHVLQHSAHLRERLRGAVSLLEKPLAASRIPYGHLQRSTAEGVWRVGDQAAVIPSFCGDGTAIAMHSGTFAAACMLRDETSAAYQQTLHGQLSVRMWLATHLSQVLLQLPQASQITRIFPSLISTIASVTRIPNSALEEVATAAKL